MSLEDDAARELAAEQEREQERLDRERVGEAERAGREEMERSRLVERALELVGLLQQSQIVPADFVVRTGQGHSSFVGWIVRPVDVGTASTPMPFGGGKAGNPMVPGRALRIDGTTWTYTTPGEHMNPTVFVPYGYREATNLRMVGALAALRYEPVPLLSDSETLGAAKEVLANGFRNGDVLSEFEAAARGDRRLRREQEQRRKQHERVVAAQEKFDRKYYG